MKFREKIELFFTKSKNIKLCKLLYPVETRHCLVSLARLTKHNEEISFPGLFRNSNLFLFGLSLKQGDKAVPCLYRRIIVKVNFYLVNNY